MTDPLLTLTDDGLYCPAGDFHVDPWNPVPRAVVTHAHSDHARGGCERYLVADSGRHLFRTRLGYELRVVGFNPSAGEYGGIATGRAQTLALAISGAAAGLAGVNFVLGYKHYFELGFSSGAGFLGIAVALLGRNHPVGVVAAALFFGALSYGGLVVNQRVPKELVEALQGLVILFAIASQQVLERAARRMR